MIPILPTPLTGRDLWEYVSSMVSSPASSKGKELNGLLGVELLARLLGVSSTSLHRYLSQGGEMPDDLAARLRFLALVVDDLLGAYSETGVRRWFDRPRALLDGRSPAGLLSAGWRPEDGNPRRVRDLAHSLVSA